MPELPDVETFRRHLAATALNHRIESTHVFDDRVLESITSQTLARRLKDEKLTTTRRHGKHLFARIGGGDWLTMHFGMTGHLAYYRHDDPRPDHARIVWELEGGHRLAYVCQRMLGRVGFADSVDAFVEDKGLGPDAKGIDYGTFRKRFQGRGTVKSALMNQQKLAGIGNIYGDEILFHAGIHPGKKASALSERQMESLHRQLLRIIEKAIDAKADPEDMPRSWLLPNREEGTHCPKDDGQITTTRISGRTAYYCPTHQKR